MTAVYWEIGRRIVEFEQGGSDRAGYGETVIGQLAADLSARFGRGFSQQNIWHMRAFYLAWPAKSVAEELSSMTGAGILQTASGLTGLGGLSRAFPLPWSAYVRLLSVKSPNARTFYETEALRAGWSVRQLDRQIGSQFYERTALSRKQSGHA